MKRTITIVLLLVFCASFCIAPAQDVRTAIETEKAAEKQRLRELEQKYESAIESAEKNFKQGQYEQAKQNYLDALNIKTVNGSAIKQKIAEIDKLLLERKYQNALTSAERNFEQRQYEQARQNYVDALNLKPGNASSLNLKIAEVDKLILERKYQDAIASAEENFKRKQYAQAKQDYLFALELKPENADFINLKIAEMGKPAQLHIYYKSSTISISSLLGLSLVNYDILLDDMVVGRTKNKWKTTVTVNDFREKTVSGAIEGRSSEVRIDFEPGNVYYVRADLSSKTVKTGEIKTRKKKNGAIEKYEETRVEYTPMLQLVSASVGEREFNAIKVK